ncbi:glyoxylase-like metal-dependent hydrolase (beta-lactamase superfamily II) [Okibacterium sp. HSC-33S16]|uniref:MBL fold metallo-hydrolase n=1 Tax=Okibacterium sp. HSC-33S16 TaxID=2910965 RepID=UPI0020A0688E|nr:MBL fold metallo-hydrolase [Okibacterium sp. HSC-33S16]MCP2032722.1 glyoxylase-like metal-dependent hydrolase (beta-lactamase superfamily II) [Okibacterium sp. HSC-33S16]
MPLWTEIADRVYVRRYEPLDISITLIAGDGGLLLVDTRCNPREAKEIQTDATGLGLGDITRVVNTHAHYDHSFGNSVFAPTATIYGHAGIPAHFATWEAPRLDAWRHSPDAQPQYDWHGVELVAPSELIAATTELDLGNRVVRLIPLGPGHTDTDLVVQVPDAGAWIVGDVIEESGPPMYGSGSFPLDWPVQVHALAELMGDGDLVVPGHGAVVNASFVHDQAGVLAQVATGIRSSFSRSEPLELVVDRIVSETGLPDAHVEAAVYRGYTLLAGSDGGR